MTILIIFITTGMPWSEYWGNAWSEVGSKLTPGSYVDVPSTLAKAGDLDRFGHHISWATLEDKVPASQPSEHPHEGGIHGGGQAPATTTVPADLPAQLSLGDVDRAAKLEGLKPGYGIVLPVIRPTTRGRRPTAAISCPTPGPTGCPPNRPCTWTSSPARSWLKATPRRSARSAR